LARLKLLALVEMRRSAVVVTPIGVAKLRNCQIVGKRKEPGWPTLGSAVGGGEEGEIDDALDLLRCRWESGA
jgi:hypothetical protein